MYHLFPCPDYSEHQTVEVIDISGNYPIYVIHLTQEVVNMLIEYREIVMWYDGDSIPAPTWQGIEVQDIRSVRVLRLEELNRKWTLESLVDHIRRGRYDQWCQSVPGSLRSTIRFIITSKADGELNEMLTAMDFMAN